VTADLNLLTALLLIALSGLPGVSLPLLQEDIKELCFGGSGAVPGDDPIDHST
jgi:hypothetical protein